jgi:hypothetical protein
MKAIAILLLASLPVPQVHTPSGQGSQPGPHFVQQQAAATPRKGGKWYLARTGHAVYCYGPVMTVTSASGGLERVATFCRGESLLVPLKD